MIRSLALFMLFCVCAATAAERQHAVPSSFQGEWNANLEHCGTDPNDSLRVSADSIRFYESGGPIRAVVTQGAFEMALIAELSGEGETWLSYQHFRLSADHTYLTDVTDDSEFVRYRCPRSSK